MLCAVAGITNAQTFTEEVEMTGTAGSGNYAPMWYPAAAAN